MEVGAREDLQYGVLRTYDVSTFPDASAALHTEICV